MFPIALTWLAEEVRGQGISRLLNRLADAL